MTKLFKNKEPLAFFLLKVVFSIYLLMTIVITLAQLVNDYQRENKEISKLLQTTQAIFAANLTTAVWTFDATQIEASINGIQKISEIVGIQISKMDKPPNWKKPFPIQHGLILNSHKQIVQIQHAQEVLLNQAYLRLIPHHFQLKKNNQLLAEVVFYSSNQIIFDKLKYRFFSVFIAAIIKTIILWLLFIWVFNKFLGKKLNYFCQAMEKVDIDAPESTFLTLQHSDIAELYRIEIVYNAMLNRVLETKSKLEDLNQNLEQQVLLRTEEIICKNQQLEQLNIEKNNFLNMASHDLKNPLTAINSFAQLLQRGLINGTEQQKLLNYTDFIQISTIKMFELIENLLDIDKIESNAIAHFIKLDLLLLTKELINAHTQQARNKTITLQLQAVNETHFVISDSFLLKQILDNLISNAIKYSFFNETVVINLFKQLDTITIEFKNQGQPFTETDKAQLFTKFSRLSTKPTANEHSTGLGLYIAQNLAALLNTQIVCESTDEGTVFSLAIAACENEST